MLTERRGTILRIITDGYITGAAPVASKAIACDYNLKVSPATVRNDMACLEELGYITRPHLSAGAVPTDKAYRYYVKMISEDVELPLAEQHWIYELLEGAKEEFEQWLKLVAVLLAHFVHNVAVVTSVKSPRCRFKHLDLVTLQDFMALLVLVIHEAKVRQRVLSLDERLTQEELTMIANRINATCDGMVGSEILVEEEGVSPEEKQVRECVAHMISAEDRLGYGRPYLEGLHLMLGQPEFVSNPKALNLLELLQGSDWAGTIFQPKPAAGGVKVTIGEENPDEALRDLSLVFGEYGIPDRARGIVGVIGPKRMDYARAISSVNCLSSLLSKALAEYI